MAEGIPFRAIGTSFELVWEIDAVRQGRERTSFRITDREQAVRWVGFVLEEPHGLLLLRAALAARPAFESDRLSDVEVIEEVLKALELRRLRVFRGVDFRGGGTAPGPEPTRPGRRPWSKTTWFEVRVVDELGEPLPGVLATLLLGARYERATSESGLARVDGERVEAGRVVVSDLAALRAIVRPRWDRIRQGPWIEPGADLTVHRLRSEPLEAAIVSEQRHTLAVVPWLTRARLIGHFFSRQKAFLVAGALPHVRAAKQLYGGAGQYALLIVGHTERLSASAESDALSLERAESLRAYLTGDVRAWLDWYGPGKPLRMRWGPEQDYAMIRALPGYDRREPSEPALRWFQRSRDLDPTGVADQPTRTALITEYMTLAGPALPRRTVTTAHGCGASFPLDSEPGTAAPPATPDGGLVPKLDGEPWQRRVEIYYFDAALGVQPQPPGPLSAASSLPYPEWVRRTRETRDFKLTADTLLVRVHDAYRNTWPATWCHIGGGATAETWLLSDPDGWIEIELPPACGTELSLEWGAESPDGPFAFGHSLYIACTTGTDDYQLRAKLHNIGYPTQDLQRAVRDFQRDYQVDHLPQPLGLQSGALPAATRAKLWAIYEELDCDAAAVGHGGPP